jgi:predicted acyltransferase
MDREGAAMPDTGATRLASLDVFRGATIAAMILVNNPGSWEFVYPPLRHAPWHGWTPTDLIFPFFLFIVGISLSLSLSRRREREPGRAPVLSKIFRRSLILFALGIFLALFPRFDFATVRIPGVLQRIAVCYMIGALIFLKTGARARILVTAGVLAAYWAVLRWIPVPELGEAWVLSPEGNLCGWLDARLLGSHLYTPHFDPEGILSTLPAVATVLLGTLVGDGLRASAGTWIRLWGLLGSGAVLAAAGLWMHGFFPINKQLWTSSFVLFTAGAACLVLGAIYWVVDVKRWRRLTLPFLVFGTNPLLVFVGSGLLARVLLLIRVPAAGESVPLSAYLYSRWLAPWAGPTLGSLLFPVLLLLFWLCLLYPLFRRRIYLRV